MQTRRRIHLEAATEQVESAHPFGNVVGKTLASVLLL